MTCFDKNWHRQRLITNRYYLEKLYLVAIKMAMEGVATEEDVEG